MTPLSLSESSFHNEHREKKQSIELVTRKSSNPHPALLSETGQHQADNMAVETRTVATTHEDMAQSDVGEKQSITKRSTGR
jgi:hypothetical protein